MPGLSISSFVNATGAEAFTDIFILRWVVGDLLNVNCVKSSFAVHSRYVITGTSNAVGSVKATASVIVTEQFFRSNDIVRTSDFNAGTP